MHHRVQLIPHPTSQAAPVRSFIVDIRKVAGGYGVTYEVAADTSALKIPPRAHPARTDRLWETTCFELFLMPAAGDGYYREYNMSPSLQWAAYDFSSYRESTSIASPVGPRMWSRVEPDLLYLAAEINFGLRDPARVAASAVIEDKSGHKSYWALAHPTDKPDFHHPDSFVLDLPAS